MPPRLLLVKHSLPAVDATLPAAQWALSAEGYRRCQPLAQRLAAYGPQQVICSLEMKARQTAQRVAELLGIPWEAAPGLHEHERPLAGLLSRQEFEAAVAGLFAHPEELVFGAETAAQAQARFAAALAATLARYTDQTLAVVAHGTVISLFSAAKTGCEPFPLWKRLGLPSMVVFSRPDFRLEEVVETVE